MRVTWRFPPVEKLFAAQRLCLLKNGRTDERNMRTALISKAELMFKVPKEGLEDLSRVEVRYLESADEISLIIAT